MYISSQDAAVIYARACRAWYGKSAPRVVRRRIEELRQAGDVGGVKAWAEVAFELAAAQEPIICFKARGRSLT